MISSLEYTDTQRGVYRSRQTNTTTQWHNNTPIYSKNKTQLRLSWERIKHTHKLISMHTNTKYTCLGERSIQTQTHIEETKTHLRLSWGAQLVWNCRLPPAGTFLAAAASAGAPHPWQRPAMQQSVCCKYKNL